MKIFVSLNDDFVENILLSSLKDSGAEIFPLPEDFSNVDIALVGIHDEKDLEKIKKIRKKNESSLLIAVLSYKSERVKEEVLNSGADEVMIMPIDPEEFKTILYSLVTALKIKKTYSPGRLDELHKRVSNMIKIMRENEILSFELLEKLGDIASIRDNETADHTQRVGKISEMFAEELGMSPQETMEMRLTAPLHDIGKIGIPDAILFKNGPLDDDEWKIMKTHTEIGARVLESKVEILKHAQKIALYHHEKYDGSGYPKGLKGENIPMEARIVTIADSFDAIVSKRPYKKAKLVVDAMDEIVKNSGTQFDPKLVKVFVKMAEKIESLYRNAGMG